MHQVTHGRHHHDRRVRSYIHVERAAVPAWLIGIVEGPTDRPPRPSGRAAGMLERIVVAAGAAWQRRHGSAGLSGRVDLHWIGSGPPVPPDGSPPAGLLVIGACCGPIRIQRLGGDPAADLGIGDLAVVPAGFVFPMQIGEPYPGPVLVAGLG